MLVERDLAPLADDTFSPVYLRNATAYGMSPRLRFDLVLNNLVAWAVTTGRIYIKSDGTPWRPIVHIRDIAQAFVAALEAPREAVHNEAFNVGRSDENYRIREIAEVVRTVVPDCEVEYAPDGGPDSRSYRVDFSKIDEMLPAFQPQWTARRGAEEIYQALRSVRSRRRTSRARATAGSITSRICCAAASSTTICGGVRKRPPSRLDNRHIRSS